MFDSENKKQCIKDQHILVTFKHASADMTTFVPSQSRPWLVSFSTTVTQEWFVCRMAQHVCCEVATRTACILTHVAFKWFDALVYPNVSTQVWWCIMKHSVAIWTDWYPTFCITTTDWPTATRIADKIMSVLVYNLYNIWHNMEFTIHSNVWWIPKRKPSALYICHWKAQTCSSVTHDFLCSTVLEQ